MLRRALPARRRDLRLADALGDERLTVGALAAAPIPAVLGLPNRSPVCARQEKWLLTSALRLRQMCQSQALLA